MANDIERELGWDDEISKESNFTLLPAGEYDFTVKSFERGRYEPGPNAKLSPCNMATLMLEVTDGDLTATLQHRLFLHSRCEGMLCEFFLAIGLRKHGEPLKMNWPAIVARHGRCKVGVRKWNNSQTGEEMQGNEIKRFLDPEEAVASSDAGDGNPAGKY